MTTWETVETFDVGDDIAFSWGGEAYSLGEFEPVTAPELLDMGAHGQIVDSPGTVTIVNIDDYHADSTVKVARHIIGEAGA